MSAQARKFKKNPPQKELVEFKAQYQKKKKKRRKERKKKERTFKR
jgi:hypothetical protein